MIVQYYKLSSKFHHRPHIICSCVNDVKWWTQHMCPVIKGWALLGGGKGFRFEGTSSLFLLLFLCTSSQKIKRVRIVLTLICLLHQRRWSPWFALFGKMILSHESFDQSCTRGEDSLAAGWKKQKWFSWLLPCPDLLWPYLIPPISREARLSSNWCKT